MSSVTEPAFTIVGRSSSSFTRVARIFAEELGVPYRLQVVPDLKSLEVDDYGGNPALKVPSLRSGDTTWFGALSICRELARISARSSRIVWPEELAQPLLANAQELVLHAMSTEVGLIMSGTGEQAPDSPHRVKLTQSLINSLSWLDANVGAALAALPAERDLSYLEVTLFCLVTHLDFRKVLPTAPHLELSAFRRVFGARPAALSTEYRFDA
ncbi:MAG TPA: glutathione S-transferase N-terminal domain-containing protein [Polyangiaceae bacterium]|nr:glutathione S-transferase N-terminal domain-containing protein [Polyangiaceae bacterium]